MEGEWDYFKYTSVRSLPEEVTFMHISEMIRSHIRRPAGRTF